MFTLVQILLTSTLAVIATHVHFSPNPAHVNPRSHRKFWLMLPMIDAPRIDSMERHAVEYMERHTVEFRPIFSSDGRKCQKKLKLLQLAVGCTHTCWKAWTTRTV
eukprot:93361-Pleurochrysis_carterae.AAC.3